MLNNIDKRFVLHNGVGMPVLGLGVFKANEGEEVESAVKMAVKAGYRGIDTAAAYGNEVGVGKAIRECDIPRADLFITTKGWNAEQGYETTLRALDTSRNKLGLEYIDLYLIHWPVKGKYKDTWKAMEKLYKEGVIRAIGVSNFLIHHLKDLMVDAEIVPMVNQMEFHPCFCRPNCAASAKTITSNMRPGPR